MAQLNSVLQAHEARANFYQLLDEVGNNLRQFTITLRGKSRAVVMPLEEYEGWLETLDIMSNPRLVSDIKQSIKELKAGKGIPASKVDKILKW